MRVDAATAAAVFEWQDGARRLAAVAGPARAACYTVVDAVHAELRRRLGRTFTVAELAAAHREASDWFLPVAIAVAPRHSVAHDPAVTLDGAFALYMPRARDAGLW
jgi:ribosomal protein L13E